jgi:hypothetical protein
LLVPSSLNSQRLLKMKLLFKRKESSRRKFVSDNSSRSSWGSSVGKGSQGSTGSRQVKVDEMDNFTINSDKKDNGESLLGKTYTESTSGSSEESDRDLVDFIISIESLDGIMSTNKGRRHQNIGQLGAPVFGVLSYSTRLAENGKVVKTNIPSMALVKSTSIGKRERWHANFGYPNMESDALEQIHLTLPMVSKQMNSRKCEYHERRLDLDINLMRGSEVIRLGFASISLCGNEYGRSQLISVGQEKLVRTMRKQGNKRISQKKKTTIGVKSVSFMKDPTRRFSLQRSNLRVSVRAAKRISTTKTYSKKESESQISQIESNVESEIIKSVGTTVEQGNAKDQDFHCKSNDDSLLEKLSGISLSRSGETTVAAEEKYNEFLATVRNPSVDESDVGTTCTEDDTLSKVSFVKFADSSSVFSGVDADGDETVTTLDNVSIGTIKFKALNDDDDKRSTYTDAKRTTSRLFQRSNLYR